jgi:peptidoglycan/LPS O-acetylase OafA/YrhL
MLLYRDTAGERKPPALEWQDIPASLAKSTNPSLRYPELDGVRGIAILAVLAFHFSVFTPAPEGRIQYVLALGWCGVDLFFALSGFLITGILLESRSSPTYLRRFYSRRLRRIAPVYYTALVIIIGASALFKEHLPWERLTPWSYLWFFLPLGNIPGAFGAYITEPVGHFWSLAIEEQFYFVWPFVVRACSVGRLVRICVVIVISATMFRNAPTLLQIQEGWIHFLYRLTPFHVDGLALGALVAIGVRSRYAERIRKLSSRGVWLSLSMIAAVVIATGQTHIQERAMVRFGYSAFALVGAFLVAVARLESGSDKLLAVVLRNRVLRSFGRYSYGIYIFHELFAPSIRQSAARLAPGAYWPLLSVLVGVALSWCAGWCSWRLLESLFMKEGSSTTRAHSPRQESNTKLASGAYPKSGYPRTLTSNNIAG